jgi:hypothetical protein
MSEIAEQPPVDDQDMHGIGCFCREGFEFEQATIRLHDGSLHDEAAGLGDRAGESISADRRGAAVLMHADAPGS